MIGCPDCGSLLSYQHVPGCRLAVMRNKEKMGSRYPDHFLQSWKGCGHLDCLPQCQPDFCQRLDNAFKQWQPTG